MIGFTLSIIAFAKIKPNGKIYAVISLSFYEKKRVKENEDFQFPSNYGRVCRKFFQLLPLLRMMAR